MRTAGAGTVSAFVSEPITGLTPGTTYHFRVVATNPSGTSNGADQTFATDAGPASPQFTREVAAATVKYFARARGR